MTNKFLLQEQNDGFYIFSEDCLDFPFDGPMTKQEAETLLENLNETPDEEDFEDRELLKSLERPTMLEYMKN